MSASEVFGIADIRMNSVLCGLDLHQKFGVSDNVLGLGFWLVISRCFYLRLVFCLVGFFRFTL